MNELEDFLKIHNAGTILDIACGSGGFTNRLTETLKSYTSVIGLDIKADARDDFLGSVKGHNISFVASTIHDYLTSASHFDTISVSNALHHLEGVAEVIKKVSGILNDRGTLIINEMHGDDLTPPQQTQHDQHKLIADLHRATGEYHRETWSRSEILGFVYGAGLKVQYTFENKNEDAEITKKPTKMIERARSAVEKAYPDGAPDTVTKELERLAIRSEEIGSSPPPQLTLVCVEA